MFDCNVSGTKLHKYSKKCRSHLEIIGARIVVWSKFHTEGPRMLCSTHGRYCCQGYHAEFVHRWVLGYFRNRDAGHSQVLVIIVSHFTHIMQGGRHLPDVFQFMVCQPYCQVTLFSVGNRAVNRLWRCGLTLILLTWRIWWAPNSAFKGLNSGHRPERKLFGVKRGKTNKMQQLDVYYQHFLNMFRASLCPSSEEQDVCSCTWCAALVLLDVVGSGCWGAAL